MVWDTRYHRYLPVEELYGLVVYPNDKPRTVTHEDPDLGALTGTPLLASRGSGVPVSGGDKQSTTNLRRGSGGNDGRPILREHRRMDPRPQARRLGSTIARRPTTTAWIVIVVAASISIQLLLCWK